MNDIWTAQEDAELLRLRRDDKLRMDVVAHAVGRPVDACFTRYYKLTNEVLQPKAPLSDDDRRRIETAFACGYSAGEIASETGRGVGNIQYHLVALGLRRGLTKAWTDEDDDIVRVAFAAEACEALALDSICRQTGRLRGAVASRRGVLSRQGAKTVHERGAQAVQVDRFAKIRPSWIERFAAADISVVEDGVTAGRDVKSVAQCLGLTVDVVRRIAKLRGLSFSKAWTESEILVLREAAGRCDTHAAVVAEAGPLLEGREAGAVLSKVKALRLVCTGATRQRPPRVRQMATPCPVVTTVPAQMPKPSQTGSAVRRLPRRPVQPAMGAAEMARLTAEFLASGKAIARASSDTDVVTALRRRGYAVIGQGEGFRVDGRLTFADRSGLEKFAAERGVRC